MRPEHYRRLTLRMRELICQVDELCVDPQTTQQRRALSLAIKSLSQAARELSNRHRAQNPDLFELMEELEGG